MPPAESLVALEHVTVALGERVLFRDLNWKIGADQHWAVVGSNGSGKTTLVKVVAGMLPVAGGKIRYGFGLADDPWPVAEQITYVTFEAQRNVLADEAFYQARWNAGLDCDEPSVSEYLSEQRVRRVNRYQLGDWRPDETFPARRQEIVERLELQQLLNRHVMQLSNGERRKVTIARAWLKNPRLLILDNPFAGLDERFREKLAQGLEALMQSEMRVMVVGTARDEIPPGITHVLTIGADSAVTQGIRQAVVESSGTGGAPNATWASAAPVTVSPTGSLAGPRSRALVEMTDVSVSYNGTPVLHRVCWTVREHEQWALLGPNGAGKTTLLSLILADNPQGYANDITLFGRRRGTGESIWEIKQHVGWVAPELQLYYPRQANCLDVVCSGWFDSVGLYRHCSPEQREIATTWVGRFGLTDRSTTVFGQVSEGEQRLVLLARALVKSPELLVLDEPCQGLDEGNRDRVLQAVERVSQHAHPGMIYVTHRADELPRTITHVLRLDRGHVVEQGMRRS